MGKFISFMLYLLWIVAIVMILATTFTNFQHPDLTLFAIGFFVFALLNSFLMYARDKADERTQGEV